MHVRVKSIFIVLLVIVTLVVVFARVNAFDRYQQHQVCVHSPQYQVHLVACP